jgi:branched-chain amino acid transport system permease protein
MLAQQLINGLVIGLEYAMFAVGIVLIFGVLRVINFAHGAIFAIGGIGSVLAVQHIGGPPSVVVAIAGGVVVGGLAGLVVQYLIFTPLARLGVTDHLVPAVATVGMAWVFEAVGQLVAGPDPIAFPEGSLPSGRVDVLGVEVSAMSLVVCALGVVTLIILDRLVWSTRVGRRMRAVAHSADNAELIGINARRVQVTCLVASAMFAGLAGAVTSMSLNLAWPYLSNGILLKGFVIVVLGGLGSVRGAVIGGLALGVMEALSVYAGFSAWREVMAAALMFTVLMARPQGLFGQREVLRF